MLENFFWMLNSLNQTRDKKIKRDKNSWLEKWCADQILSQSELIGPIRINNLVPDPTTTVVFAETCIQTFILLKLYTLEVLYWQFKFFTMFVFMFCTFLRQNFNFILSSSGIRIRVGKSWELDPNYFINKKKNIQLKHQICLSINAH